MLRLHSCELFYAAARVSLQIFNSPDVRSVYYRTTLGLHLKKAGS